MHTVGFNIDQSLLAQSSIWPLLDSHIELPDLEQELRLWPGKCALGILRQRIARLREELGAGRPLLSFLGSGDLHYVTLLLLESLYLSSSSRAGQATTLVLVDNHPDWFDARPKYHCGNWVSSALRIPAVQRVIMIGQSTGDIAGRKVSEQAFRALSEGRLQLYPFERSSAFVPLKWPVASVGESQLAKRNFTSTKLGSEISFRTVSSIGLPEIFSELAIQLKSQRVYLSIDKDAFDKEWALTDWEQGQLKLPEVLAGIKLLQNSVELVGVDIVGERAPSPLRNLVKCIDAFRLPFTPKNFTQANIVNERANQLLLRQLSPEVS